MSHNALNFLHKFMRNNSKNFDEKAESLNKNLVLSQKCGATFAKDAISFIGELSIVQPKEQAE